MTVPNFNGQFGFMGWGGAYTWSNVYVPDSLSAQLNALSVGYTGPVGTFSTSKIIDGICEGPIEGWPTPTFEFTVSGTGTNTNTYTNVTTTGGSGSGIRLNVVSSNGAYQISNVTINTYGPGYAVNDAIKVLGTSLGGATPANDLTLTITAIGQDFNKYIYLDGTPVSSYSNGLNIANLQIEFKNGTGDQTPLSSYNLIGAVKTPNFQGEIVDINNGGVSIIQQIQIRDDTDGAYPSVEAISFTFTFPEGLFRYTKKGGREATEARLKIELSPFSDSDSGWETHVDDFWRQEITGGEFEVTYVIEIPPGWTTPKNLQQYSTAADDIIQCRITKSNSDYTNNRAHSKIYLKSYSIYTKNQFSHPYTSLVGITIDSKNFDGSIPRRQYELKLLKVKVPSNYNLVFNKKTGEVLERNYSGSWDGTFKEGYWTDNPVWCFYDLVTNTRYGLGKFIDSSLLNKWKLYEIAKYCDAVVADTRPGKPANSFTFSLPDGFGGVAAAAGNSLIREPRFTCNVYIYNREEAFSVVQRLASLFRSIAFFHQGTLQLIQDKPSTPTFLYNNTNVIDGIFTYQSSGAKARHTVAVVKWLDPNDLYSEKLEYVEDYDGIARYGYREIEVEGFGTTSRGQARRIGRHILITEKFEIETISFRVGIEGAIVTPGNLIKVKDSYRQIERSGGRIVSATNNSITLDKAVNIPSGATNIQLWVQIPSALNETIETNTTSTFNPNTSSYFITAVAGSSNLTTLTLSGSTFSTTPTTGNIWILSYTPSGSSENTSVYKVLSVVENNPFEYEITALQHYSNKYDEIEAYAPIPSYKPEPLKLYTPPPDEGFVTSKFNGKSFDIEISWRTDRYISGTKYKIEIITNTTITRNVGNATSYILKNAAYGTYYFKIYALNNLSKEASEPLVLGPFILKNTMPQNSFDSFSQNSFGADYISHKWPEDKFPSQAIKYEVWRAGTNTVSPGDPPTLRTLYASANINTVSPTTDTISLTSFDQSQMSPISSYYVEVPILPYVKYTTFTSTTTSTIVLNTLPKPTISIGDKIVNTTRNGESNVVSFTQAKNSAGLWVTTITISPTIGSQTTGDIIYIYKGVLGSAFVENTPSGAIKQKTLQAINTTTSPTNITVPTGQFLNVATGDIVINRTRNKGSIVTKVNNQNVTTTSIPNQAAGDIIAFYQHKTREARNLKKYKIDLESTYLGVDIIRVLNFEDPSQTPIVNQSIMLNVTKGICAHVINVLPGNQTLQINTAPSLVAQGLADGDEVCFIHMDEVYTQSINTHIHPVAGVASAGTNENYVVCSGLFAGAKVGDLLVNATKNTSRVILSPETNQVGLISNYAPSLSNFKINNQTTGDIVFYVPISSFVEQTTYTHPNIITAGATTSNSVINVSAGEFAGVTSSYKLYNMTRNSCSSISPNTSSRITVSPTISGQTTGDKVYAFLPSTVTSTNVTAPDGAFSFVRPGDTFYNVTRNLYSTVEDVVSLTGTADKKIDRIKLSSTISPQAAGDSFRILQGYFTSQVLGVKDNGTDDKLKLETVSNLSNGDRVNVYKMTATQIGTTAGTTLTDTGLSPNTTYYYWMRAVSNEFPFIAANWRPSETFGDTATTTIGIDGGNYNTSNDNDGSAIAPSTVSRVAPFIDLPPGGVNKDSTANIRLYWEWTGIPNKIDGFAVYFWSSNSETDDATIDADEDYSQATSIFTVPTNPRLTIASLTYVGSTVTVNTFERHNFTNGMKVKILNAKAGSNLMAGVNTSSTTFVTVTVTSVKQFTYTAPSTPSGTYTANSGRAVSCLYEHQIDNLTANYWYNAWVQPYRQVNTTISENGIIVGSPTILYL